MNRASSHEPNGLIFGRPRHRQLRRLAALCVAAVYAGQVLPALAVPYYLDDNSNTAGSGVTTPVAWNTGTTWSTDSTGSSATIAWADGNQAVFSAGNDRVGAYSVTITGTVNPSGIHVEEGSPTISGGTINLGADILQIDGGTTAIQSIISGAGGFTKTGAGTLVVGGNPSANSYTGKAIVSQGILGVTGTVGDGTIRGDIDIASGATLRLDANNMIINTSVIDVAGGATFNRNGFGDAIGGLTGSGNIIGGGTLELDLRAGLVTTFSGSMTGAALSVRGNNQDGTIAKQVLTGTLNTSGGNLDIKRGNGANDAVLLQLAGNGTSTVGSVRIGVSGSGSANLGVLDNHILNATALSIGDQNGHAGTMNQSGGTVNVSAAVRIGHWPNNTSSYNLSGGALNMTGIPGAQVNQSGVAEQNGVIYLGIDGTGNFVQTGGTASAVALVLDGRGNTAGTDTLTLNGGKMSLGNATNATTIANSGIFSGSSNANTSYLINLGGGTLGANANWNSALNMTLTGVNGNANIDTDGFNINLTGVISGPGGLNKLDNGTLSFNKANTYTGNTVILGGTLALTGPGSIADSPVISIANGAFLNVSGTTSTYHLKSGQSLVNNGTVVGNLITDAGSSVSPGLSIGTLNFTGNLDIDGGLVIEVDPIAPAVDMINVAGILDISGATLDLSLSSIPFSLNVYVFAKYGTLVGNFADVIGLPKYYWIDYNYRGQNQIALVPAPEPATLGLLAVGGLGLLRRRRETR